MSDLNIFNATENVSVNLRREEKETVKDEDELILGQISLRFPEALIQKIKKSAKAKNMMFSEYLRRLLIQGMNAEGIL